MNLRVNANNPQNLALMEILHRTKYKFFKKLVKCDLCHLQRSIWNPV